MFKEVPLFRMVRACIPVKFLVFLRSPRGAARPVGAFPAPRSPFLAWASELAHYHRRGTDDSVGARPVQACRIARLPFFSNSMSDPRG